MITFFMWLLAPYPISKWNVVYGTLKIFHNK